MDLNVSGCSFKLGGVSVAFSVAGFRWLDRESGGRNSRDGGLFTEVLIESKWK